MLYGYETTLRSGNSAADQENVTLNVNLNDYKVLDGYVFVTVLTCHVKTLDNLCRVKFAERTTLTVNGTTLTLSNVDNLTLDCRDEEAWSGSTNRNSTVTGSYPALGAGENEISWTGGISAVEITPRWWTL